LVPKLVTLNDLERVMTTDACCLCNSWPTCSNLIQQEIVKWR